MRTLWWGGPVFFSLSCVASQLQPFGCSWQAALWKWRLPHRFHPVGGQRTLLLSVLQLPGAASRLPMTHPGEQSQLTEMHHLEMCCSLQLPGIGRLNTRFWKLVTALHIVLKKMNQYFHKFFENFTQCILNIFTPPFLLLPYPPLLTSYPFNFDSSSFPIEFHILLKN